MCSWRRSSLQRTCVIGVVSNLVRGCPSRSQPRGRAGASLGVTHVCSLWGSKREAPPTRSVPLVAKPITARNTPFGLDRVGADLVLEPAHALHLRAGELALAQLEPPGQP